MRGRGLNRTLVALVIILLLGAAAVYIDLPNTKGIHFAGYNNDLPVKLGLDLTGGLEFHMQAHCPKDQPKCDIPSQMGNVINNIDNRINGGLSLTDAIVRQEGTDGVLVQLPGLTDDTRASELLGKTGQMYIIDTGAQALQVGADVSSQICTDNCAQGQFKVVFKGSDLDPSSVQSTIDPTKNTPAVSFQFAGAAKARFADYTRANVGRFLTIVLDNQVIESATIQTEIDGPGQISGNMSVTQAKQLESYLKYGALPLPLEQTRETQLAPTLGVQAIHASVIAAGIGLGLVVLFMLIIYRLPGLLADLALILYALFLFAIIKLLGVTLSLPGIAAVILTIGMAVDANILIFERMKEELRSGRTLASAVDLGFKRAWPSIRDSNVSTMITCVILYWFGNTFGATLIVGFAINLFIGVAISLFTAVFVTRNFLNLLVPTGLVTHPGLFGLPRGALNVPRYNRPTSRVAASTRPAALTSRAAATETSDDIPTVTSGAANGAASAGANGATPTASVSGSQGTTRETKE